jgi:hypothetical protein
MLQLRRQQTETNSERSPVAVRAQGLTLPDFILVSPEFRWKGAGGVVAAGFLGNDWQIDESTAYIERYFSSDHVVPHKKPR